MYKRLVSLLILVGFGLSFCTLKKEDDKDKEKLALSVILLNQGQQATVPTTVSGSVLGVVLSVASGTGSSVHNQKVLENFLYAYTNQWMSQQFPYLKSTAITASNGSCTYNNSNNSYNCNATLNGTATCKLNGGSVTFDNVNVNMTGVYGGGNQSQSQNETETWSLNFTATMNGNVSYSNCKISYYDMIDVIPKLVTLNGSTKINVSNSQSGTMTITTTGSEGGSSFSGTYNSDQTYTESGSVEVSNFSINEQNIGNQTFTTDVSLNIKGTANWQGSGNSVQGNTEHTYNGYIRVNGLTVREYNNTKRSCTYSYSAGGSYSHSCQ